jgi:hypothetical protein
MRTSRIATTAGGIALVGALALLAGCGSATEQLTEAAIENQTGGDVDVKDDGSVEIRTDDGEMTVSGEDGKVTIESGDGTYQAGEGTEVPDDFPAEIPLVDGGTLTMAVSTPDGFSLIWNVDDAEAAFDAYIRALEGAGFELGERTVMTSGGDFTGIIEGEDAQWRVGVTAGVSGTDPGTVSLFVTRI